MAKAKRRPDDGSAFLPDPYARDAPPAVAPDDLAEQLAEDAVKTATTGEDQHTLDHESVVDEENGGPFVQVSAATEIAHDEDATNPPDATREPLPTPMRGP
jgi:hypothetical protein